MPDAKPNLKVGVDWVSVEVVSEPYVILGFRGYAPVIDVQGPNGKQLVYISSKSISEGLDPLVQANGGKFTGLKLRLRKASEDKMAPYEVEKA
ncbi:MAG TPA: hypothetical protein VEJ18_05105 [Planctomycetota bacterium]|nr:hypothetical protein [Planctomycetota bacterium]